MTDTEYAQIRVKAQQLEKSKKGYLAYLCNTFNCDKPQARKIYDKLVNNRPLDLNEMPDEDVLETEENNNNEETNGDNTDHLIFGEGYVYNQETDKYIVQLRTYGGQYVCPGDQHRAMLTAYSNWNDDEKSIQKIATLYKMRREWVVEYFRIMKWTHDTVPITDEEIKQGRGKEATDRVLDTKKTSYLQELQKADWQQTQEFAREWVEFQGGKLDPFDRVLRKWVPKPALPIKLINPEVQRTNETLLVGLSDLHFGGKASKEVLFSGKDFNSETIRNILKIYAEKIANHMNGLKAPYRKVAVCSLGDILHTLTGFTVKGVPLSSDVIGEEQFDLAMDCLVEFLSQMLKLFPEVDVYAVKGNHAGVGDYILYKAIAAYFQTNKRIRFNLFKTRQGCFRIGNVAILMDHGASDVTKSIIPTSGPRKEAYIQALFLAYPNILTNAKCRLMLQGDRHRFMCEELRGFEHVILGSCVLGDAYADNLGLHSRARQNCLVLGEEGLKQIINFYFD